jgi:DNA primase
MQLDKEQVLDFLRKEGKNEQVQKAIQELPQKIDHEQHAQMLQQKFGIDPGKLAEKAIENQLGVESPSHKPANAPAHPAPTPPTANEQATASSPRDSANAPTRPASTASNEATTDLPSNEPTENGLGGPADAAASSASTGTVEDDRPPA